MSIISGTTIEYETKKHGEITSAYTYSPFFAAWNNYILNDSSANTLCRWSSPTQTIRLQQSASENYIDLLWLFGDAGSLDKVISVADDDNDTLDIITKLDIQKYKLVIDGFYIIHASDTGETTNAEYKSAGYQLQENEYIRNYITHWEAKNDPTDRTSSTIPVLRYTVDTETWYFEIPDMFPVIMKNNPRNNQLQGDLQDIVCISGGNIALGRAPMNAQGTWTFPSLGKSFVVDANDDYAFIFSNPSEQQNQIYITLPNIEAMMKSIACLGVYFEYDGVMYLGFMDETGQTTGEYLTADKWNTSAQYQSENINNYTEHNPPYVPPAPEGDDIDTQHFGGGTGLGGAENLWLLTTAQMQSLHAAISSCNEPNFEPLNSIISVIGLAVPPIYPLGTDISTLITITFKKADGTRWSSHVEGHICDKQTASFGFTNNIKIKRRYNNFLDYPPYANHEIFLPLCGWLPLPAYAVGRNLQVYYVHDINTCSVRALVLCEGSVIGEKYGTMGANIAFSSNGHALYLGGLISGGVQTLADFTTAMISEGPMALMSAMKGIAEGANTLISANQNRTSVIGQNQDRTSFADGQYIRIKSTYPDVKIEENFGHTFGFVCNKKGQLKDFKGFTTCENPHVYGFSCTSEEKDEIERLLKAGIIINIAEE